MRNGPPRRTLALEFAEASVWSVRPHQLVSLLEMLTFNAGLFHLYCSEMLTHIDGLTHGVAERGQGSAVTEDEILEAQMVIEHLYPEAKRTHLKRTIERLDILKLSLPRYVSLKHTVSDLLREMGEVNWSIGRDLADKEFLCLLENEAEYYDEPNLFGPQVRRSFPDATKEITEAGNCYATGNYTACVFHLMRAVEHGARAMVKALRVRRRLSHPVELCQWGELLTAMEHGLRTTATGRRKSVAVSEKSEFFNHAVAQFRNFKDAWRNNVAHTKKRYKPGETKDILDNTRQFMQHLALRIKQ